jgi:hypothetical protein
LHNETLKINKVGEEIPFAWEGARCDFSFVEVSHPGSQYHPENIWKLGQI